jgi:tripartite ATP-independent transporter DctM subunit
LFLAGIVPGLIMGLVLMMMNTIIAHKRNFATEPPEPLKKLPKTTIRAFPALLMPAILLYGIYGGVTTPTEAAAIAALYALFLTGVLYKSLSFKSLYEILVDSAKSSAAVGVVIGGAFILNYIVITENIPGVMTTYLQGIDISPLTFLLFVNVIVLLLGCFLDATTIILVIIPLFIPVCKALGIDLIHFGVLVVVNSMIGLITPPYGILLFVINAVTGISLKEIISEIWIFILVLLFALGIMIIFPEIILWLPEMFGYKG